MRRTKRALLAVSATGMLLVPVVGQATAQADAGGVSDEHRIRPARPAAPPPNPRGLAKREDNERVPDRPPQANTPELKRGSRNP